jgi:hypothetical protein
MLPIASALLEIVRDVRDAGISVLWRSVWPSGADDLWIVNPVEAIESERRKNCG